MTERVVSSRTQTTRFEAALAAGMSSGEAVVFDQVTEAASAYIQLVKDQPHHGMELDEVCQAFHTIQGWLALRATIRRMETAQDG